MYFFFDFHRDFFSAKSSDKVHKDMENLNLKCAWARLPPGFEKMWISLLSHESVQKYLVEGNSDLKIAEIIETLVQEENRWSRSRILELEADIKNVGLKRTELRNELEETRDSFSEGIVRKKRYKCRLCKHLKLILKICV
jgi:hypothetical protein